VWLADRIIQGIFSINNSHRDSPSQAHWDELRLLCLLGSGHPVCKRGQAYNGKHLSQMSGDTSHRARVCMNDARHDPRETLHSRVAYSKPHLMPGVGPHHCHSWCPLCWDKWQEAAESHLKYTKNAYRYMFINEAWN
jgi:hypothetical protein